MVDFRGFGFVGLVRCFAGDLLIGVEVECRRFFDFKIYLCFGF